MHERLRQGLYEALLTSRIEAELAAEPDLQRTFAGVDPAEQPSVLARHLAGTLTRRLVAEHDPAKRLAIVNSLLGSLDADEDMVEPGTRQLLSLFSGTAPGAAMVDRTRPTTPLSDAALLTNSAHEPSLGSELRAELSSADAVDLLCAFVRWPGLRILESQLRDLCARRAPFRVITTTYLGGTERAALDRLVRDFGAEVKVQYGIDRTRLHAKAWLFRRNSGYDTAYVGSSNLSSSALLEGVEWNVRLSEIATPTLMQKFGATFETYWHGTAFETYDPDHDRDRLDDALALASGARPGAGLTLSLSGLQVQARPHQARMLEELEVERVVHDRHRNLVVAATGTGKTVVAALDYRRMVERAAARREPPPSLLFVAHRGEILRQSLSVYREVLGDPSFGELYVGGARPERWKHVFASVQSLAAYDVHAIPADTYEVVVIDEFHHAEAPTYRRIMDWLEPRELLGLTATPERSDGTDVRSFFGGRTACELRLWDALADDLLCPFHYFGIADGTDLTQVEWTRGRYDDAALSNVYTGNHARAAVVLRQLADKVADVSSIRALGFCVSVAHAQFMASVFTDAGVPSLAVSGVTSAADRAEALRLLRTRGVNVLFAADLFNEGLDLPEIDTLLFLRPTESATIFLQQLGRGLRQSAGKAVLTVLDFVGNQRREFRFDQRYRALTGATRRGLIEAVEHGFPFLPSGCQIVLDEQTQRSVLSSVKSQLATRWPSIVAELRAHPTDGIAPFLDESGVELSDVLRADRSWTRLRREAQLPVPSSGPSEGALLKRVRTLAHVDDQDRATAYRALLADRAPSYSALSSQLQRYARMLFFSLWPGGGGYATYDAGLEVLRAEPAVRDELRQVIALAMDRATQVTSPMNGSLGLRPLRVHAQYTREEVLAALDYAMIDARRPNSFREGVLFAPEAGTDAFFVTLRKSDSQFSPTTMYRDYALSPSLFHWESQSGTTVASPTGQRYLHHREQGTSVLIFSRPEKASDFGSGAPYVLLGTAQYVSHRGERPIAITWKLDSPMPPDLFQAASVVA